MTVPAARASPDWILYPGWYAPTQSTNRRPVTASLVGPSMETRKASFGIDWRTRAPTDWSPFSHSTFTGPMRWTRYRDEAAVGDARRSGRTEGSPCRTSNRTGSRLIQWESSCESTLIPLASNRAIVDGVASTRTKESYASTMSAPGAIACTCEAGAWTRTETGAPSEAVGAIARSVGIPAVRTSTTASTSAIRTGFNLPPIHPSKTETVSGGFELMAA